MGKVRVRISRCPVCNKVPTVIIDMDDFSMDYTGMVAVQCKPLFRKPHLRVEAHHPDMRIAVNNAVLDWNKQVHCQQDYV